MKCKALPDRVLVHNLKIGERVIGGIILTNDNCKEHGIRPRWAQIYDIGSDIKCDDIKVGQWVLISHGRWTRGFTVPKVDNPTDSEADYDTIYQLDWPDGALMVSDDEPEDTLVKDSHGYGPRTL